MVLNVTLSVGRASKTSEQLLVFHRYARGHCGGQLSFAGLRSFADKPADGGAATGPVRKRDCDIAVTAAVAGQLVDK